MSEVKLEIKPNENGELILRDGQAAQIYDPIKITEEQLTLNSLVDFAIHRIGSEKLKPENSLVLVNLDKRSITLNDDVNNEFNNSLVGSLAESKYLKRFKINTGESFRQDELVKLIRFNKRFIEGEYDKILKAIEEFKIKITQDYESKAKNRTGSKSASFNQTVENQNDLPKFTLNLPLFTHSEPKSFEVEVWVETRDAGVSFKFESPELEALLETEQEELFQDCTTRLDELDLNIIYS